MGRADIPLLLAVLSGCCSALRTAAFTGAPVPLRRPAGALCRAQRPGIKMQTLQDYEHCRQQLDKAVKAMSPPDPGLMKIDPLDAVWSFVNKNERQRDAIMELAMHAASLQMLGSPDSELSAESALSGSWELVYSSNRFIVVLTTLLKLQQEVSTEASACGRYATKNFHSTVRSRYLELGILAQCQMQCGANGSITSSLRNTTCRPSILKATLQVGGARNRVHLTIPPWLRTACFKRFLQHQVLYLDPVAQTDRHRVDWDGDGDFNIFKAEGSKPTLGWRFAESVVAEAKLLPDVDGLHVKGIRMDQLTLMLVTAMVGAQSAMAEVVEALEMEDEAVCMYVCMYVSICQQYIYIYIYIYYILAIQGCRGHPNILYPLPLHASL